LGLQCRVRSSRSDMSEAVAAPVDELDAYERTRFLEARAAGLTRLEARRFAFGDQPLHLLWKLRDEWCAGRLIARIVC
jgi:hypothetical protein